jgi:DNA polymerase IIIc chi subunit
MAANIVFIVLNSAVKSRIVCDLAEKCYLNDRRIVVFSESDEECRKFDSLLWTWKQQSFVPHKYIEKLSEPQQEPIVITSQIESNANFDTVLMIDPLPVETVVMFQEAIDFAEKYDSQGIELSRKRYKIYKEHNLNIDTLQPGEFLHTASI